MLACLAHCPVCRGRACRPVAREEQASQRPWPAAPRRRELRSWRGHPLAARSSTPWAGSLGRPARVQALRFEDALRTALADLAGSAVALQAPATGLVVRTALRVARRAARATAIG